MSSLKLFTVVFSAAVLSACGGGKVVPNSPEPTPSSKSSVVSSSVVESSVISSSLDVDSSSSISSLIISSSIKSSSKSSSSIVAPISSSSRSSSSLVVVPSSKSSSSAISSSLPASIYYVRGTFNTWGDKSAEYLMAREGVSDNFKICINFTGGSPSFKVDPNGGWGGDELPASGNVDVAAGWVSISFNSLTKTITTKENLDADCANAGSVSSSSSSSSTASTGSSSSVPATNADVKTAMGTLDSRLACYKGAGEKACNLRTYQVMVESFIDGDGSVNMGTGYGTSHHKGDLEGVIKSLDYIKSLGVNTLWLTPVFDSTGGNSPSKIDATGYFASNYFKIDSHFGTEDKLKTLIDTAHAKGLYVLLDGVFGHAKSGAANYNTVAPFNTASPGGRTLSGSANLLPYPANLEFFKEVATYWVTNYKIDGWRLDQAYQVPVQYWNDIRAAVETASAAVSYTDISGNTVKPLGYMVGEIWDSEAVIKTKGFGTEAAPGLLSAFDFPMRYRLVQTLAMQESGVYTKQPATHLNTGYLSQAGYPAHAMPNLMLTNHDLVRFGDLIQRGNIANPTDDQYWSRHKAAFSFMAAYSGPITLYYGDEIGQEVANFAAKVGGACDNAGLCDDHVSRDSGFVEGITGSLNARQSDLKNYVASLMNLREAHPALWNGSRTYIYADASVYIDRKDKGNDHILYALNTTNAEARISVAATAIGASGDLVNLLDSSKVYSNDDGVYYLVLAPFEAAFLQIAP